ncbi:hypothetical protein NHX12_014732 [Muraenolepis orangiensis]|uniref:Gem-associated protein 8 n=1 Tax=Muraenolepis orangiensis TaxID=630683 RepID=A0A9Q0DAN7_9TELE|nr:hypothetical protein NHX12_014732 [Muraenolepis orangiensis]
MAPEEESSRVSGPAHTRYWRHYQQAMGWYQQHRRAYSKCDVSNMEITEELRQYFAQTEKHKEELRRQQELEAEELATYVPADQDLHRGAWLSSAAAPNERPGARRGAEMKKLYGEDAAKIQAMEAALQLHFDRNCDRRQPKYWPVIPLRL